MESSFATESGILKIEKDKERKKNMKIIKKSGVRYYLNQRAECVGIKVEVTVTKVSIWCTTDLYNYENEMISYPNVTELIIEKDVQYICLPNTLFPNIKKIVSHSKYFLSGDMLITYKGRLLNAFCKKEDEIIDMGNVSEIYQDAFCECSSVNLINTRNVHSIHYKAFKDSGFEHLKCKNGLAIIDTLLIIVDPGKEEVTLPKGITAIDKDAQRCLRCIPTITVQDASFFANKVKGIFQKVIIDDCEICREDAKKIVTKPGVKELILNYEIKDMTVDNSILYFNDTLIACPEQISRNKIVIPDGVTTIAESAFRGCESITEVYIPASVTKIEEAAFSQCRRLRKVTFHKRSQLKEIGPYCFEDDISLTKINIPNDVKAIQQFCFTECEQLQEVILPKSLKVIEKYAFWNCKNLTEMEIPEKVEKIEASSLSDVNTLILHRLIPNVYHALRCVCPHKHSFTTIKLNNKSLYITKTAFMENVAGINRLLNKFANKYTEIDDDCINKLVQYLIDAQPEDENECMLYYALDGSKKAKEYLKLWVPKMAPEIVKKRKLDEPCIMTILKLHAAEEKELKMFLAAAQEHNATILTAYILNEMKNIKTDLTDLEL